MRYRQSLAVVVIGAVMVAMPAAADTTTVTLKVDGMTQTGCSSPPAIRGTASNVPGVRAARVNLEQGEMTVEFETGQLELKTLITTVEKLCQVKITPSPAR
jgi:copper chaperone CopZ